MNEIRPSARAGRIWFPGSAARSWVAIAAGAALAGCVGQGPGGGDDCQPGDGAALHIGEGSEQYTAITSGGEFPLVHGPQGGFHLAIGLAATRLDASDLVTGHLVGTIDGTVYAQTDPWLDFRCEPSLGPAGMLVSWGTLLIYSATPEFLDGKVTNIDAEVTDASGETVRTSATFVIRDTAR